MCCYMEDSIINVINNVGFPIAVSIALFYQVSKTNDTYLNLIRNFQDVIANNTKSIDLLNVTIEQLKSDLDKRAGEDD